WKQRASDTDTREPWKEVRSLRREFFLSREAFLREKEPLPRLEIQRAFTRKLLGALGYDAGSHASWWNGSDGVDLPLLVRLNREKGAPELLVLEHADSECETFLDGTLQPDQFDEEHPYPPELGGESFETLVSRQLFSAEEPPRWVLLVSIERVALLDRMKWREKRFLEFDLEEIFSRNEETTFQALTILLARECVAPRGESSLLDNFDEQSHRHASAVSEDLKYALRRSIELLGNEAATYLRRNHPALGKDIRAEQLTRECLTFMYRILFVLFIESRGELGFAPVKSEEYMEGYSFESLRDIVDTARLQSEEEKRGTYLHQSLQKLFSLVYNGYPDPEARRTGRKKEATARMNLEQVESKTFTMPPLKSHLFDPDKTPLLKQVTFRNETLASVIDQMSISRPKSRKQRPARISYNQLGINQLGAVYEALLSYRGFFAHQELYEVKKAGDSPDELEVGYFVTADQLQHYTEAERVRNPDGSLKSYPEGSFIYRLAGREKETSASYYTPEVLTQCLVKYALKELLQGKSADDILQLRVCEPAMGSAAFINEAVNGLAEAYLQKKQKELGESIPHDRYAEEKQKVKMFIADNNVYGVDLNPVAVELAEVSIWLNTIYRGGYVPWFGTELLNGNSLVGAGRKVYAPECVVQKGKGDTWHEQPPERVEPGTTRPPESVYHFLLPDPAMARYTEDAVKAMEKQNLDAIKTWSKAFCQRFTRDELKRLQKLSSTIDRLWKKHLKVRKQVETRTRDALTVYGQPGQSFGAPLSTREKDEVLRKYYHTKEEKNAGPYARLKMAMDYWCALWYWPIRDAELLPTRAEFFMDMGLILEGNLVPVQNPTPTLFEAQDPAALEMQRIFGDLGQVDLDFLCSKIPRLARVRELSERHRFFHWELEYTDVFEERGGFDLVLGNPPWIKVGWEEKAILSDYQPLLQIRKVSASDTAKLRDEAFETFPGLRDKYLAEYEGLAATQNFLNATQNYPVLKGMKANLYKCFLPRAWEVANPEGVQG
ncbi:MAG TPA: hypothetical protein PLF96_10410, partial [Thermotogota bacterium]|nr:hypothetical protein [Thermotogota bacterium]